MSKEISTIRKNRYLSNLKLVSFLFVLGCSTIVAFLSVSPLTEHQKRLNFEESGVLLYWLMYAQQTSSTVISSFLAMAGSFFLYSLIDFVSLEFDVLGVSFRNCLGAINHEKMKEIEAEKLLDELKFLVRHYQRLLE